MEEQVTEIVSEITKFSTRDGPGIRTTVFLKGCPLRCKWCSNPETFEKRKRLYYVSRRCSHCGRCQMVCPQGAISSRYNYYSRIDRKKCDGCMKCVEVCLNHALSVSGEVYTVDEIVKIIERDKVFYGDDGGVTISGGEPLSSAEFVLGVFRKCREKGIGTVLDTTGYGDTAKLREILEVTDLVLLDIKQMDAELHQKWTGVSNQLIQQNAAIIMDTVPTRISIPLIPGVNDNPENIKLTAELVLAHGVKNIDLNLFHTLGADKYHFLGKQSPYHKFGRLEQATVDSVVSLLKQYGLDVGIGRML